MNKITYINKSNAPPSKRQKAKGKRQKSGVLPTEHTLNFESVKGRTRPGTLNLPDRVRYLLKMRDGPECRQPAPGTVPRIIPSVSLCVPSVPSVVKNDPSADGNHKGLLRSHREHGEINSILGFPQALHPGWIGTCRRKTKFKVQCSEFSVSS